MNKIVFFHPAKNNSAVSALDINDIPADIVAGMLANSIFSSVNKTWVFSRQGYISSVFQVDQFQSASMLASRLRSWLLQ